MTPFTRSALTRRTFLVGLGASLGVACAPVASAPSRHTEDPFAGVEAAVGGRVGVFALDTGSLEALAHRPDERFAMCSTFKWALAAAVLARVDHGDDTLGRRVAYSERELLEYAPVTRAHAAVGYMTVEALAAAAVTVSDNTAANLLLQTMGGPAGLTRFFRAHGDNVTRLDRSEPALNTNLPGDPRDTTSPRAMVGAMRRVLTGDALSAASRARLLGWLEACRTGRDKLRAGLPSGWVAGDKTGSGEHGASNDVAIVWPPRRRPILIAAYLSGGSKAPRARDAAHAEIGRIVAARLAR